jgi:hypothetical protein
MKLATVTPINQVREMPSNNGYVHLWRDIKKQPFYQKDHIARSMMMDMLLDAQYNGRVINVSGVDVILNVGQLFTSKKHFMDQGISESKTKTRLAMFEKLGVISRQVIKDKSNRSIGQRVTFLNWNKWQKIDLPSDLPVNPPEAPNIKALAMGVNLPLDPPLNLLCNKVSNNKDIKESDRQANLSHLKSAFEHIWKKWKSCKSNIGKTDTSPKTKTFDKNFKSIFNTAYFNKNSQAVFKAEINQLSKFIEKAHEIQGFNRFENMQLPKFLNEKQWRD